MCSRAGTPTRSGCTPARWRRATATWPSSTRPSSRAGSRSTPRSSTASCGRAAPRPRTRWRSRPTAIVLSMAARLQDGVAFPVANWNARLPKGARVSAYTSRGGNVTPPPGLTSPATTDPSWCAARLTPTTAIGWTGVRRTGLMRSYVVEDQPDPCPQTPERVGPTSGAVVLAGRAGTDGGRRIRALMPGDAIQLAWSFAGWPGVTDVVGGTPILVSQGRNVAPALAPGESYFYSRNPRTAAGVNAARRSARAARRRARDQLRRRRLHGDVGATTRTVLPLASRYGRLPRGQAVGRRGRARHDRLDRHPGTPGPRRGPRTPPGHLSGSALLRVVDAGAHGRDVHDAAARRQLGRDEQRRRYVRGRDLYDLRHRARRRA